MAAAERDSEIARADVCIVGAGPVGLALAFQLESLGLSVTLVEMGANGSALGAIEFENGHHASSGAMSRPGIGGASALWGGRCVGFDDLDFEARQHVPFSQWPIRHDVLTPYYAEALAFLKCNPDEPVFREIVGHDPAVTTTALERWSNSPDIGPIYADRLQLSKRIRLVHAAVTGIGLASSRERVEHLRIRNSDGETTVLARNFVLAGGGLENARLLLAMREDLLVGHDSGDRSNDEGPFGRFYQGHLTGYIAVLKFNRSRTARDFVFQKDAAGYVFRRRMQMTPATQAEEKLLNCVFWIDAISIADPVHGSGALSLLYMILKTLGLYRRLSNGLAPTAKGPENIEPRGHWRNVLSDRRTALDLAGSIRHMLQRRVDRWRMLFNPAGRYLLRYHAEQVPNPESRVVRKRADAAGGGSPLAVDYRVAEQDLASVLKSHEILDGWLRRNGIGRLEYLHDAESRREAVLNQAFDGYHQIGLARMAQDPADGVTDADCRVHGIGNLYLAGSCLFPTGGHANPTLPAVALALRLAGHLKQVVGKPS